MSASVATGPHHTPAQALRAKKRSRNQGGNVVVYAIALAVVALTLGPVLYGILGGFRSNAQLAENPAGLPKPWVLDNYAGVLKNPDFWQYALNSSMIAVITTVIVVVLGIMAAYPLARYKFRMREPIFMVFVLGLLFPATVAIVPLFILITRDLHLGNTWWGVALPQAAFALPMTVVIMRQKNPIRAWSPSGCWPLLARGMPTCCRCFCCKEICAPCPWALRITPVSTLRIPPECSPLPPWR